ncbi:MAG: aminoacyl-tRNA hydrolase [Desulfovibrionaceae bacterium]
MNYEGVFIGLGNPGQQYEGTRHNIGFTIVDKLLALCERDGRVESLTGTKFKCLLWRCTLPKDSGWWLVAKPQTFMNLSGECAQPLMAWHRLSPDQAVVIHDELDIKPGFLRFKTGGGNAGHNGLKSINQMLGTPDFHRLRVGIGRPPGAGDVTPWVLGRPAPEDSTLLSGVFPKALEALQVYAAQGSLATSQFSSKVRPE